MPPLRCFTVIPHRQQGFVARLVRRKVQENGFIEINNLLARRPVEQLAAADVETILSNYEVSRPHASERLNEMYRNAVQHLAKDDELSSDDRATLKQLRYVLGLDDSGADGAQRDVVRELYRVRLKSALANGFLSHAEKTKLEAITGSFGIPGSEQQAIYKEEVLAVVQQAFNEAVKDERLTAEEEQRLAKMSENLGVKITHDAKTEQAVARFRLLAQIESGTLPVIPTPMVLQRGETCHGSLSSRLLEQRTVTKVIRYSGPTARIRIMKGLSWRVGSISLNRVTSEELREIDSGTLYITNKRLLFNGANKNFNVPYKKIVQFTAYKDGLKVEKDSGRDQCFKGDGDMELLGAVLETCIRLSRES